MSGLTKHQVPRLIPGLGKTSVNGLIGLGALEARQEFNPNARRMVEAVTRESVEAFKARYVALGELCQTSGLNHKRVRQRLRLAGVEHAFPYEEAGAFIYARRRAVDAMNA
jgi:hypothetical protein